MKNVVITGDSLSYNRHSYDDTARKNATDCLVGMNSWSFRLRKELISKTRGFVYGDEINVSGNTTVDIEEDKPHLLFGERTVTVTPKNRSIHIKALSTSGRIALFLQRRPMNYARFSLSVDGEFKCRVDTFGEDHLYHGYEPLCVEVACSENKEVHEIVFSDFESTEFDPFVTIVGLSEEGCRVNITGQGSRTAKFILYHIDERIIAHRPDTLILIFGGNDVIYYSPEEYRTYLTEIFAKIKKALPDCRIITVTVPPSAKPPYPVKNVTYTTDAEFNLELDKYNEALISLSDECIKSKELFKDTPVKKWRYDSVHMTQLGNDMLFDRIISLLN